MGAIKDCEIKTLKVGDVFYECQYGLNIKACVVKEPIESISDGRKHWVWDAENTECGSPIKCAATEGLTHYGPRLYREPQYTHLLNNEVIFEFAPSKES